MRDVGKNWLLLATAEVAAEGKHEDFIKPK